MPNLLMEPLFIISICILLGHYTGKLGYKYFKLGSSATLFIGLILSYLAGSFKIQISPIPSALFTASLIGFIVAVGLRASKSIKTVLKDYGIKFLILSIVVTASGALSTLILSFLFVPLRFEIIGTYVGALTSSPGLATALELAKGMSEKTSAAVGLGYAISYIPGVLIVIFFSQLMGRDKAHNSEIKSACFSSSKTADFSIPKFTFVIILGIILGLIEINFGKNMPFSLGITGGALISSLILGSCVKGFDFNNDVLDAIKNLSLNAFLAIVGLNYGFSAISSIKESGAILLIIGFVTGFVSISSGYIFGKYILKMKRDVLIGGICGSMTSTPGLAAALEVSDSEDVVVGYGAAYPFALLTVIMFTNYMFR